MSGAFGRGEDVDGDTVGPVMESVIRSLTDEYERQLIAKEEALKVSGMIASVDGVVVHALVHALVYTEQYYSANAAWNCHQRE